MMIYFSDFGPGGGAPAFDPADLFGVGDFGDFWVFDAANTDATVAGDSITAATGTVNSLILEDADPSHAPKLQQPGGDDVARFDGTADRLVCAFGSSISQPGTLIVCLNNTSTATHVIATGSSAALRWQISNDSSDNIIAYAGSTLDSTQNAPIGTKVIAVEFNGVSSKIRFNGTQTATGNTGAQATNQLTIGALYDGSFGGAMDVYCVLFIDRLLTADELDDVERYMGALAGLSW